MLRFHVHNNLIILQAQWHLRKIKYNKRISRIDLNGILKLVSDKKEYIKTELLADQKTYMRIQELYN